MTGAGELLAEFAAETGEPATEHDKGLFDKVKDDQLSASTTGSRSRCRRTSRPSRR